MGEVSWGTHLCQFYRNADELRATLVPFFKTGLEQNECCLWVTAEPLHTQQAYEALRASVPDVDQCIARGQLAIIDSQDWYLRTDGRRLEAVLERWLEREADALRRGFAGLRVSGNTSWLESGEFRDFADYEEKAHAAFQGRRIVALCAYFLPQCAPEEVFDVLRSHQCALLQRDGEWEIIQSATLLLGPDRERALVRLHQLTEALGEARSVSEIAVQVAAHLTGVFGANRTELALFDGERKELLAVSQTDAPSWSAAARTVNDGLPVAHAYRTGAPVWLSSRPALEARFPTAAEAWPEAAAVGCLPLRVGARCIGAIGLLYALPRVQSSAERALLEDYVRHVALTLDRALYYEACTRAQHRLQLLEDATDHIAHARLDLHEVLETIVREIARPGFADGCAIHLASGHVLTLGAVHHLDPQVARDTREILERVSPVFGQGILGGVAASGKPLRLSGRSPIRTASHAELHAYLERNPVSSLVVVPMRSSGALLGTLAVSRARAPAFVHEDQQLIEQLAARAALAIENAQLYERAQRERARAEVANRAKDEFLAMLGHELRNPLSPILTAVQLMRLKASDTLAKERTMIERQVHRMVRLVDDLLDVSRVTRGKVQLKRVPVELASVVSEAIETASPLLEERAHRLEVMVSPRGLLVEADPARLAQVIANLLMNAAKYTPPGGHIQVLARARESSVELCVRDSGVGINPELLPRVFELFVQGKQESDRAQGGLGLGLAIARSLMELHGGKLSAHSDGPGRGSVFTLELPLPVRAGAAEFQPEASSAQEASGSVMRPKRILVVDDNVDAAHTLADALGDAGHDVQVAHDGPSALQVAESFRPELALLDIGLPLMDGYELGGRLLTMFPTNPPKLIAVTGYGQQKDRMRSTKAGFQDHLVKPVDLGRLTAAIDAAFQGSAQQTA